MCLRVFVATRVPIAPTAAFEGQPPPLSWRAVGAELSAGLEELLGGAVVEAGSHTGCACGFELSHGPLGPWNGVTRISECDDALLAQLDEHDREQVTKGRISRAALCAVLQAAIADGPVAVYGVWWGEEMKVDDRRTISIAEMRDALEAFPERVILHVVAS